MRNRLARAGAVNVCLVDAGHGGRPAAVARETLARMISARTGLSAEALQIASDGRGAPIVVGHPWLHVSIAHSGPLVACALSAERKVGVDIERLERVEADEHLAAKVCSERELRELAQLPVDERRGALIRLWARKEAVSKALGVGMGIAFDQLDVRGAVVRSAEKGTPRIWIADVSGVPVGYAVAVAGEGSRARVRAEPCVLAALPRPD